MSDKGTKEDHHTLELLDAIGRNSDVSQRHLAKEMGIALGLANSYLKRCVRKGYVKIKQVPANRYLYYLTPKGFSEKSRLTAKYLTSSFSFYRKAGESCLKVYDHCQDNGWRKLLLCGLSDLAEIAALRALETDVEIVGLYDPHTKREHLVGMAIWRRFEDAAPHDACMLTDVDASLSTYGYVVNLVGKERMLVPDILRLERRLEEY